MSDLERISSYSSIEYQTKEKISIRGWLGDPVLNSTNQHHKSCMVDSKENHSRDLGGERVKLEIIPQILQTYWQSWGPRARTGGAKKQQTHQNKTKHYNTGTPSTATSLLLLLPSWLPPSLVIRNRNDTYAGYNPARIISLPPFDLVANSLLPKRWIQGFSQPSQEPLRRETGLDIPNYLPEQKIK